MVHSLKPDPVTNLQDPNRFFNFFASLGGMATHMLTYVYSDLGIPRSYRQMDGNSVHAYKFVNAKKQVTYVKFRWFAHAGVRNLTSDAAMLLQGRDFNHATRDLYDAIRARHFPRWDLSIQLLRPAELSSFAFDPLDATKEWPETIAPFHKIGELELNRVPANFHQWTEQSAFSPGNFLPGAIEPSEDRLLQGRLLSYHDSQVHRLGSVNFNQLPVNRARSPLRNYGQDGIMDFKHYWEGSVNFEPNGLKGAYREDPSVLMSRLQICGSYAQEAIKKTLDFRQAGDRYRRFDAYQRANLVQNIAGDLGQVRNKRVRNTMCAHFYKADKEYGQKVARAVKCDISHVLRIVAHLRE